MSSRKHQLHANSYPGVHFRMPERFYGARLLWGVSPGKVTLVEINQGESHVCVDPAVCQGAVRVYTERSPVDAIHGCLMKRRGHVIFLEGLANRTDSERFWKGVKTQAHKEYRGHEAYYKALSLLRATLAPPRDCVVLYLEEEPECHPSC